MIRSDALIKPVYSTKYANKSILLGRDILQIAYDGHRFECPAEVSLHLQPRLRLTLNADLSNHPAESIRLRLMTASGPTTLQYGPSTRPFNALMAALTKSTATFIPNPERMTLCENRRTRLKSITFHVMNFPAFRSQGEGATDLLYEFPEGGFQRLGQAILEHGGWRIEFQTLPEANNLIKQLMAEGGFAITHVGRLTRENGSSFWISQAEAVLSDLHQFLSFVRGLWVPLVLPVGLDAAGNRAYEEWGVRLATAWEPRISWFDDHNGQALGALYPYFIDLLNDPDLGEAVKAALYWYLRSNRAGEGPGVDSGVILSQAALERLTNAYLSRSGLPLDRYAKERFRRVFRQLNIPTAVPKGMSAVSTGRRKHLWVDLPELLVKVRNELTHSRQRLPIKIGKVVPSVWMIVQWYIELCILALAGYRGVYSNRLQARWRGEVERVPWAK